MATNLQKSTENFLRKEIQKFELEKFTDEILDVARESIALIVTEKIRDIKPGQSRIGGPPDLVDESQWPRYGWGDRKDLFDVFFFQIALSDLPHVNGCCLPTQGLLSIFSDSQIQAERGAVLYFQKADDLQTQRLPDLNEFGDEDLDEESNRPTCFHNPRKIEFEKCISIPRYLYAPRCIGDEESAMDRYFQLSDSLNSAIRGKNIGRMYANIYQGLPEEDDPSWFSLINLHSESDYFNFGDCGNTAISLLRSEAKSGNFSGAKFDYCECD